VIFKPSKAQDKISSYRPEIALTSIFCNFFESMLMRRLGKHLKLVKVLDPAAQGAFRAHKSS
jgi:hypothetical protein